MKESEQLYIDLSHALIRVARIYKTAGDKVASQCDLSQATAWPAVKIHEMGGGVRPGEIAEALGLDPSSVVRVIDQLIEAKLVTRKEDETDRRAKLLSLTDHGRKTVENVKEVMKPFRRELFSGIPKDELKTCLSVIERLGANIRRHQQP